MNNILTFIPHYKKLVSRKIFITNQLNKQNIKNFEFYENFDGNELTEEIIASYHISDENEWNKKTSIWKYQEKYRKLKPSEISLSIKFGKIFDLFLKTDFTYLLLLEDDVILQDNFKESIEKCVSECSSDWDAIYPGIGANLVPSNIEKDKKYYLKSHPASKCTDTILLTKNCVSQLKSTWFPFTMMADFEFGHQHYLHNHNVYWVYPPLTYQGSQTGLFESSIQ